MGTLYLVRHVPLGTVRVVKFMRSKFRNDSAARQRFRREAQTALQIQHPHIVRFFDYAVQKDGTSLLVMEYIPGVDLAQFLREVPRPSLAFCLTLADQALEALKALHRIDVVHRDISPENLMLTTDSSGHLLVKLIDLGLAKPVAAGNLTETGVFMGKLKYASPEQVGPKRQEEIGPRTDLYSLGVILYEALTGAAPFLSDTLGGLVYAHLTEPPRPFEVTDSQGRVPADVRETVLRALAKSPAERFSCAKEFQRALMPALQRSGDAGLGEGVRVIEQLASQKEEERRQRTDADGLMQPRVKPPASSDLTMALPAKRAGWRWVLIGGALLLFVFAGYLARGSFFRPKDFSAKRQGLPDERAISRGVPETTRTGYLKVTTNPWSRLERLVESESGQEVFLEDNRTPFLLPVKAGKYRLRFVSPESSRPVEVEETVKAGEVKSVHLNFIDFDVERLIRFYVSS